MNFLRKITGARCFLFICMGAWVAPAQAAAPNCTAMNTSVGRGVTVVRQCTATENGPMDAYYRVAIEVIPGEAFRNQAEFEERSGAGRILAGVLRSLTGASRATSVDISVAISQGGVTYPPLSLLNFRKTDRNAWVSSVRGDPRSFLHRLTEDTPFQISLNYTYSRTSTIDLTRGKTLLDGAGIGLVTPATEPIFNAVSRLTESIMQAGNVTSESAYGYSSLPSPGRFISAEFQIADPATHQILATVKIRLEGSRSLFAPAGGPEMWATSLPDAPVSTATLTDLPRRVATGQVQRWGILNAALGSASFPQIPIGKEPTPAQIQDFCGSLESGLSTSFSLSSFDSLLVRAHLLDLTTRSIQAKLNPYLLCFRDPAQRALIKQYLPPIDPDYVIRVDPELAPFTDFEALYRLGCYFTGKTGPTCSAQNPTREGVGAILDETIAVPTLEGVSAPAIYQGLDASNRSVTRANFFDRFGGKFFGFSDINTQRGTIVLREVDGGPALVLVVERNPGGKVARISIRRLN